MENKTLTIMFTDMKDFTRRTRIQTREEHLILLERHESILIPCIEKYKGRIVKTLGDSFLVVFESPTNALLSAMEIQSRLSEMNKKAVDADQKIELKIGVNSGEVYVTENDVTGDPVNLAARIVGITEPQAIFFSEAVYLTMNKTEVPHVFLAERVFKGIDEPIKIYKVKDTKERQMIKPDQSPFRTQPATQSAAAGYLTDEIKPEVAKIDPSQLERVFDFTNVKEEKRFEVDAASKDPRKKEPVSSDILELDSSVTDFASPDAANPVASSASEKILIKNSEIKTDAGFELSKELLDYRRKEKSKKRFFFTLTITAAILFGILSLIGYNYYSKVQEEKERDALKKEIENSPIMQALNKRPEKETLQPAVAPLKPIENVEYSSLSIVTQPTGATIWIDGKPLKKKTPALVKKMKPHRSYHLVLTKKGYKPYDILFDLLPDEKKEIEATLSR